MVPPLEESEDGNRASFPSLKTGGKRSVISNRLASLQNSFLNITETGGPVGQFY